ncbi:hypothetical protein BDV33DRAFT_197065 [Aspergillus novoparasiticus]|uniref:BZIP domain-containing protein n=1 Tax=Aspergillus novoparasiticus TaxID=986946 RepID=A0A5N6E6H6_9EURO|nr:hypothetical protein BDV33DRAFT_197065 [Aspergillus novoparasiticus]
MRSRQIITPVSPSARFVSSGFVQETQPGTYTMAPGSPLPVDSVTGQPMSVSGYQQPVPVSVHSTPTFHNRWTSVNPTPNPSPKETSPTTPISNFSQFRRSSPVATTAPGPQPAPSDMHSTPHKTMEPHVNEEPVVLPGSQPENPPDPGMIPCILDLKSGSSSQAEKRKANSDASRRFRNRKRNELQMQAQEIRDLLQERDFYRSERDFYREHVGRLVPSGQIPARPASPRSFQHSNRDHQV